MRTKRNAGKVMDRVMAFRTGGVGGHYNSESPLSPLYVTICRNLSSSVKGDNLNFCVLTM